MTAALVASPGTPSGPRPARRSLVAFGCLAAGFILARAFDAIPAVPCFVAAQLGLIIALLTCGAACRAALCIAAISFGTGWFGLRIHETRPDSIDRLLAPLIDQDSGAHGPLITIRAAVLDQPEPIQAPGGSLGSFSPREPGSRFRIRVESIIGGSGPTPASGTLLVSVLSRTPPLCAAGDRVQITGTWSPIRAPSNPGEPDARSLAAQDGVAGRLHVTDTEFIEVLPTSATPFAGLRSALISGLGALRARARTSLDASLALDEPGPGKNAPPRLSDGRSLLAAMLLGDREPGLDGIETAFRRLGLVHLVAISGFNLAIVAGLVLFFLRLGPDRPLLEPIIVAVLITLYMLVVPAEAPILRSGITVLAFLAAEASGRRYDRLNLLGWTAAALILYRPLDLFSLGFQLSFGIVAALLWLGQHARDRLFGIEIKGLITPRPRTTLGLARQWFVDWGKTAISTSVLAWSVAIPTIAFHTGLISPLAAITSIVVLPLVVVALWVGYTVVVIGALFPPAASALSGVLIALGDLLAGTVTRLDDIPGMVITLPRLSVWLAAAATALILYWFVRGHTRDRAAWGATAALAAWFAAECVLHSRLPGAVDLRIDTLALGRGQCRVIRCGHDAVLWDCGSSSPAAGLRTIPRALRELGVFHARTAVITRSGLEYFNTLVDTAEPLGLREALVPATFLNDARARPGGPAAACLAGLVARGVAVRAIAAGETIPLDRARLDIISPDPAQTEFQSVADASLIGLVTAGTRGHERRVLLAATAGPHSVAGLLMSGPPVVSALTPTPHAALRAAASWIELRTNGSLLRSD